MCFIVKVGSVHDKDKTEALDRGEYKTAEEALSLLASLGIYVKVGEEFKLGERVIWVEERKIEGMKNMHREWIKKCMEKERQLV